MTIAKSIRKMTIAPNTKLMLAGSTFLVALVSCSVTIASEDNSPNTNVGRPTSAKIVRNVRSAMTNLDFTDNTIINAYIIPSTDAHFNEFPVNCYKRIQYVSGFTGSFAEVVISESAAILWTDKRFYAQAQKQLDNETWTLMNMEMASVPSLPEWLVQTLPANSHVGIDPNLITSDEYHKLGMYLEIKGLKLKAVKKNLVDAVWKDRPERKLKELEAIDPTISGRGVREKLTDVRKSLKDLEADSFVVTALDDIAWLLNLRGHDLDYSPLFFAYVIITEENLSLYLMNVDRYTNKIDNHFQTEHVDITVEDYDNMVIGLQDLIRKTKGKILLSSANKAIQMIVAERELEAESPIKRLRIIKNDIEANGMREAHKRDGAAFIMYLHWLESEIDGQKITELSGLEKLKEFKSQYNFYRKFNYQTISAVGSHTSIPYYTAKTESDKQITRENIYLINADSQYKDGTTDVTRTVHFGTATDKEKDAFTRVLKGFIAVATAIFPPNAPYSYFDAMAKRALWDAGLDYDHDTGHGIGAHLNVHEYPPLLSNRNASIGMCKNMFTTNEPGYYKDGEFGIRIKNVLQVVEVPDSSEYFGGKGAYKFQDITMIPIQTKLINIMLLTDFEIAWLNRYHDEVRTTVGPLLSNNSAILEWLEKETQHILKNETESIAEEQEQKDQTELNEQKESETANPPLET